MKKILAVCAVLCMSFALFLIPVNAEETLNIVSTGKTAKSAFLTGVDGLLDMDKDTWWSGTYDPNPVWAIIKLGDEPVAIDGFRVILGAWDTDSIFYNPAAWKFYATNDDKYFNDPTLAPSEDDLIYDSVKDTKITRDDARHVTAPCYPVPAGVEGADAAELFAEQFAAMYTDSYTNYAKFDKSGVKAKYVIYEITDVGGGSGDATTADLQIVGTPKSDDSGSSSQGGSSSGSSNPATGVHTAVLPLAIAAVVAGGALVVSCRRKRS